MDAVRCRSELLLLSALSFTQEDMWQKNSWQKNESQKDLNSCSVFFCPPFFCQTDFSNQTTENLREKTRIQLLAVRDCYFHPSLGVAKPQIRNPNLEIRKNYGRKDASQKPSAALQAATKSLCATGDASTSISSQSLLTRLRSILRTWAERWGQNDQKRLTLWFIVLPS